MSVRVFPVIFDTPTVVTLEGFALLPPRAGLAPSGGGARLYRTGDRVLVVRTVEDVPAGTGVLVDREHRRVVDVLDVETCRRLFPAEVKGVVDVPCVDALWGAISGRGLSVVGTRISLVALEEGRHAPTSLFVGRPEDAPLLSSGDWRSPDPDDPPPPLPPLLVDDAPPSPDGHSTSTLPSGASGEVPQATSQR